ncbi:Alginate lyase [Brevundimonas sp. SH203]|uniref:alginate lyase family protein n=1 Tax=Brevundimonas sp. SH203 TaxID=345167 RepID=UPI0009D4A118|nr:alginate lyase family protein [Brevundimonas sp. SH203]GAW41138.1 Alginate lyase [Brevundimonas sp. SH203]
MKRLIPSLTALVAACAAQAAAAQSAVVESNAAPVCDGSAGYSAVFEGRRTFLWRPDWLSTIKVRLSADASLQPAWTALKDRADAALSRAPYTVVDKTMTPASGDKHDYMSMGPYWWPDRSKRDGLPYVRRDGQFNPERNTDAFDVVRLEAMSQDVQALALTGYFTGDPRYAVKAGDMIRAWFLTPATRMNPNFNHGQAVPGRVSGRAEGVIDAHRLMRVVEAAGLLSPTGALTSDENQALQDWFGDLVQWMATSPIGRQERAAENNHGLYYDTLITHFALFAGMDDVAAAVAERAKTRRLAAQIEPDGSLPKELTRTRSLHYTTWTLTAAFDLADEARCVGVDLWNYRSDDGRSLRGATDFVAAYAGRETEWRWPELNKAETEGIYEVLQRAAWAWSDPSYADKAALYAERNAGLSLNLRTPPYTR